MLAVTEVDDTRLKELNISIRDTGTHILIVEYPRTPNGGHTTVLFRGKLSTET